MRRTNCYESNAVLVLPKASPLSSGHRDCHNCAPLESSMQEGEGKSSNNRRKRLHQLIKRCIVDVQRWCRR